MSPLAFSPDCPPPSLAVDDADALEGKAAVIESPMSLDTSDLPASPRTKRLLGVIVFSAVTCGTSCLMKVMEFELRDMMARFAEVGMEYPFGVYR